MKNIVPYINLIIASSALTFQVTVLYPCHLKLSKKIDDLMLKHYKSPR